MTRRSSSFSFLQTEKEELFGETDDKAFEDFADFCKKRAEKLDKLKSHERCPGETECVESGECFKNRTTLDTLCKFDRCSLFFTKRDSTPKQYEILLDAAVRLKELRLAELPIDDDPEIPMTIWELEAFLVLERAGRIFQNEKYEKEDAEDPAKSKEQRGFRPGTSTAFQYTDEQLREMYEAKHRAEEKKKKRARERQAPKR